MDFITTGTDKEPVLGLDPGNPTTGRYTQADPLGLVDGSSRYAYVGNDPLQQIDPEGQAGLNVLVLPDGSLEFNPPFNDPLEGAVCTIQIQQPIINPEPMPRSRGWFITFGLWRAALGF